ncbi:MAG: DNA internalization-related competence protein ComEC/Rec2 [Candidatus Binatia bacterium]
MLPWLGVTLRSHLDNGSATAIATTFADYLRGVPPLALVAVGMVAGDALAGPGCAIPALLPAVGCGVAGFCLFQSNPAWRRCALLLLALSLAHIRADWVYRPQFASTHVAAAPQRTPLWIEALLADDPEAHGSRSRLLLDVTRLDDGGGWRAAHGYVWLTIERPQEAWQAGDIIQARLSLRRPRNFGNPGEFDYEGYLARRGVYVTAFANDDTAMRPAGHRLDRRVSRWLRHWRRDVGALLRRTLPEPQAGVLAALIVGTDGGLPRDLRAAFSRAGVSHVLSISGLHVALVAGTGYAVFRWLLGRSRWLLLAGNVPKLAAGWSAIPVLLYAGIAGSNIATIRSVVMILVVAFAVLVDRQRHFIASLALAAILILLSSPGAARDISFQLSFAAVLGLVWGMQRFWPWWLRWEEERLVRLRGRPARGRITRIWRPLAVSAVVSLSALAATTPLTALHFNQVCLVAPLANAVVVPLLGSLAVGLGLLAALLLPLYEPLAQGCAAIAGPIVWLGLRCVHMFAALPYAAVRVVTPTALEIALLYTGMAASLWLSGQPRRRVLAVVTLLACGDATWWYAERYHRPDMRITFLSVGQGDSAVVEFPGAEVMVIDAGGGRGDAFDIGERVIAPFLWSRKIGRVDYLVLSHAEWDHYGGFAFLVSHFAPREFWSNGADATTAAFARLQQLLTDGGVRRMALHRGDARQIGRVRATIHAPASRAEHASANNRSLVLALALGDTQALFTGDIERRGEEDLVSAVATALRSAIVKVPHHGSATSSTPRFLDAAAPRHAIVSAGFANRFRFPHVAVARRYTARGCRLWRTDLDGAVRVRLNERGVLEIAGGRRR